jgi:hypothetical protein
MVEQICRASTFSRNGFATLYTDDLQLLLICFLNPNHFHIMEPLFPLFEIILSHAAVSFSLPVSSMLVVFGSGWRGREWGVFAHGTFGRTEWEGEGRAHTVSKANLDPLGNYIDISCMADISCSPM